MRLCGFSQEARILPDSASININDCACISARGSGWGLSDIDKLSRFVMVVGFAAVDNTNDIEHVIIPNTNNKFFRIFPSPSTFQPMSYLKVYYVFDAFAIVTGIKNNLIYLEISGKIAVELQKILLKMYQNS